MWSTLQENALLKDLWCLLQTFSGHNDKNDYKKCLTVSENVDLKKAEESKSRLTCEIMQNSQGKIFPRMWRDWMCGTKCVGARRTNWKQLRTEGSMLEPPKEATSPSCRGIWMESWSRRPRRRWSQKPVALATCLNKTGGQRETSRWGQVFYVGPMSSTSRGRPVKEFYDSLFVCGYGDVGGLIKWGSTNWVVVLL